jgi:hypothetical protein
MPRDAPVTIATRSPSFTHQGYAPARVLGSHGSVQTVFLDSEESCRLLAHHTRVRRGIFQHACGRPDPLDDRARATTQTSAVTSTCHSRPRPEAILTPNWAVARSSAGRSLLAREAGPRGVRRPREPPATLPPVKGPRVQRQSALSTTAAAPPDALGKEELFSAANVLEARRVTRDPRARPTRQGRRSCVRGAS